MGVFGVRGNFDDCQSAVKEAFNDGEFNRWLHDCKKLRLSSANSINWGRLLPQIVYYASAYVDLAAQGALKAGELVDVCVPTGNFGNILAAFYAREIGVPIDRLLCASNENDVLADFLNTGIYDISGRPFVNTPSPSMDILISSNLERLLHRLAGPEAVRTWMADLARTKRFEVDPATFQALGGILSGGSVTNDESLATIRRVWREAHYLLDPHTAVAWSLAERMRGERPMLVVSTAHWAKFGADVLKALRGIPYAGALSADPVHSTGTGLLAKVLEIAQGCSPVPRGLTGLDEQPERFLHVVDAGRDGVESAVRGWLGS